ncbi:MAG: crotonase/enoyl-CoA hydratase family protein [Pseudomonadota bacterium]
MFDTLEVTREARGVATLWLARAEKHNAMSGQMIEELEQAAKGLGEDDSVRVVVLAARGKSFCAGADLGWMRDQFEAAPEDRAREATKLARMLQAFNKLPKPLIGRVEGNVFGGGLGLLSVCDAVVAVDHAEMALTETRLGLIPATIGPYVCARMGEAKARRVFMSGRRFSAAEARDLGIVARVVAAEGMEAALEAEIRPYLSCAPGAVARSKTLLRSLGPVIDETVIAASIAALVAAWEDPEAAEGIGAFFEKRSPAWMREDTDA